MNYFLALVGFNVFDSALRASIITAATPNIGPFFAVSGAAIIIYELSFCHLTLLFRNSTGALPCKTASMI